MESSHVIPNRFSQTIPAIPLNASQIGKIAKCMEGNFSLFSSCSLRKRRAPLTRGLSIKLPERQSTWGSNKLNISVKEKAIPNFLSSVIEKEVILLEDEMTSSVQHWSKKYKLWETSLTHSERMSRELWKANISWGSWGWRETPWEGRGGDTYLLWRVILQEKP